MSREITNHLVAGELNTIVVIVQDEPGPDGASHVYELCSKEEDGELGPMLTLYFQNGPVKEVGINGITCEALLAVIIDRLASFQAGPLPCDENKAAQSFAEHSLHWLQARTAKRLAAQVEGLSLAIPNESPIDPAVTRENETEIEPAGDGIEELDDKKPANESDLSSDPKGDDVGEKQAEQGADQTG